MFFIASVQERQRKTFLKDASSLTLSVTVVTVLDNHPKFQL